MSYLVPYEAGFRTTYDPKAGVRSSWLLMRRHHGGSVVGRGTYHCMSVAIIT